jgi:hypothetical protein
MITLLQYLETLNSSETSWGIWVNPHNVDDFRVGQSCFEKGGMLDDKIYIGNLESLSFGDQSDWCAFNEVIGDIMAPLMAPHKYSKDALREAFFDGKIHETLAAQIENEVQAYNAINAYEEASDFVNYQLPDIIAEAKSHQ